MSDKLKFFECIVRDLAFNIYAKSEEEARSEVEKRLERIAPILF